MPRHPLSRLRPQSHSFDRSSFSHHTIHHTAMFTHHVTDLVEVFHHKSPERSYNVLQSGNEELAPFSRYHSYQSNINLSTLLLEESQHIVWNIDYYLLLSHVTKYGTTCFDKWMHMFFFSSRTTRHKQDKDVNATQTVLLLLNPSWPASLHHLSDRMLLCVHACHWPTISVSILTHFAMYVSSFEIQVSTSNKDNILQASKIHAENGRLSWPDC